MRGDCDGGSLWLCPLCQQGQPARASLSAHLTEKHSVLPACLDKLLDIATPMHGSGENSRESNEINGSPQQTSSLLVPQDEGESGNQGGSTQGKEECDEMEGEESDCTGNESDQDTAVQSENASEASISNEKSNDGSSAADGDATRPFKCHACLEFFPTRSALSVHYNSTSHIQRMRTGVENEDATSPPLARPYVSCKPYQCAVCRVSYNHAITLESHLKSVLHQSRSRSAGNASANSTVNLGGSGTTGSATTSNGATPTNAAASQISQPMTKDEEQVRAQSAPSLLSSPVSSAQAVSAFLTLLTSSPNSVSHSIVPSLFTTGPGSSTSTTPTQIIPQPQMLMPLILNGLQPQNTGADSPKPILQQPMPVLGLNAAQQALIAQGLTGLQSQWAAFRVSGTTQTVKAESTTDPELSGKIKREIKQEPCESQMSLKTEDQTDVSMNVDSCALDLKEDSYIKCDDKNGDGIVNLQKVDQKERSKDCAGEGIEETKSSPAPDHQCSCPSGCSKASPCPVHNQKSNSELQKCPAKGISMNTNPRDKSGKFRPNLSIGLPMLTEFQSQVLWAFLESKNDSASPQMEDCESLGREVGLSGEEVRRWLINARSAKDKQKEMDDGEESLEDEEGALMIDESEYAMSPSTMSSHAMDLSSSAERHKDKSSSQDLCLTSDSENEEFYTSVVVTDEESQSSSSKEEPSSPTKPASQVDLSNERSSGGGKVLRSTTVFLSDAEDDDEDDQTAKKKKRKREHDKEESECKREKPDVDLDVQLEAQADPPTPLSVTLDTQGLPAGILHPLPLSLSLAQFPTQLFSPYVLSVPPSVVGVGVSEADRSKVTAFTSTQTIATGSLRQTTQIVSNGSDCDSALDLSIGKNHSSATSTTLSISSKSQIQKNALLDGLGLRPTTVGVPADGSLIVVQVKPDSAITIPKTSNALAACNNLAKASAVYMRAAEKVNASLMEREKESEQDKARDLKRPNVRRFRDMRRSRTIIQADQLDVLYGCYFKDPNPGKHEFEQISEWVHLPKKVVQIWFQNMRARERKGEVRFISDGTLAAVGKPLIKFTWPLTKPIFSSTPKSNSGPSTPGWVSSKSQPGADLPKVAPKVVEIREPIKVSIQGLIRPKEAASTAASSTSVLKTKVEGGNTYTMVKIAPKSVAPLLPLTLLTSASAVPQTPQTKVEEPSEVERKIEPDAQSQEKVGPGTTNHMASKPPTTAIHKSPSMTSQKHNGIGYWSSKGQIKINTLSREQLGLGTPRSTIAVTSHTSPSLTVTTPTASVAQSQKESYFQQHSTPRRPRTHLNCLQLSILQSCYETCAHPNCLECEAIGTELGLPLKVVQIWFQNTRAKEKRWRLQQEKMSPNSSDPSKKVDMSSGTYLQYNALRANRPILPKPVQLTVLETPSASPGVGQSAARETLRGKCDVCNVEFESRAAARDHVFSPAHLAKLRSTNFGQGGQLNNGSVVSAQTPSLSPTGSAT